MYSTNLKNNRYLVRCLIAAEAVVINYFVIDTGARITCCNYNLLDGNMQEKDFAGCEFKLIGGLIRGDFVKFYKYQLKQFTIGNIDMGKQSIWITFDERVTDIILGMDILKQVMFITNPYSGMIYFCRDSEDYHNNFKLVTEVSG